MISAPSNRRFKKPLVRDTRRSNPRREQRDCVPMKVANRLAPPGPVVPTVVMLDERYRPYDRRGVAIENLCGMFLTYVEIGMLRGLIVDTITPFGVQHMLFHAEGNVVVDQGRGFFKACRSAVGLADLSQCLYLETPRNRVHMLVLTARLGKRVQVESAGFLERSLYAHQAYFRITPPMDDTNNLRLEIKKYGGPFEIDPAIQPLTNDWTVTGRGAVIGRFTWPQYGGVNWDDSTENLIFQYSERVISLLESCC
jgi:hypothetical protein